MAERRAVDVTNDPMWTVPVLAALEGDPESAMELERIVTIEFPGPKAPQRFTVIRPTDKLSPHSIKCSYVVREDYGGTAVIRVKTRE